MVDALVILGSESEEIMGIRTCTCQQNMHGSIYVCKSIAVDTDKFKYHSFTFTPEDESILSKCYQVPDTSSTLVEILHAFHSADTFVNCMRVSLHFDTTL